MAKGVDGAPSLSGLPVVSGATLGDSKSSSEIKAPSDGLKLKRFVVARKIENREPVAGDQFALGSAPVYAFVESRTRLTRRAACA